MKRILIPITGVHTPLNAIAFAAKLINGRSIPVTGVFLKEVIDSGNDYFFPNDLSLTMNNNQADITMENDKLTEDQIRLFKDDVESAGIEYQIKTELFVHQFIDEILPTDLIVADTRADFLVKLLPQIPCPACLFADNEMPAKVVLLHDGSESARHAINTYTSFLPEWSQLPTFLVSINPGNRQQNIIHDDIHGLLTPMFSNLSVKVLDGRKDKELVNLLEELGNSVIVVMGAFGRTAASMFFHESLAEIVLEKTRSSLFIAHV